MKKFISLLLALVMTFSVATIAFAADETTTLPDTSTDVETEPGTEEGDLGDFQWLLDLPLWTAKPLLKVAKVALKFVKVYLKISAVFNNIPDEVVDGVEQAIKDIIENAQKPETAPAAIA
ncbi:MAG: hypothetical protein IKB12_05000 [Clostridia bacterium]|nr:hypothetical protein [Clostridia bacterium]